MERRQVAKAFMLGVIGAGAAGAASAQGYFAPALGPAEVEEAD